MERIYHCKVAGTGSNGQTWIYRHSYAIDPGMFSMLVTRLGLDVFEALTQGKAIYGKPGLGCDGPYTITSFEIFLSDKDDEEAEGEEETEE